MSKRIETLFVPWGDHQESAVHETLAYLNEKREYDPGKALQTWWKRNKTSLVEVLSCQPYRPGMEHEFDEYTVLPYTQIHQVKWVVELCVRY